MADFLSSPLASVVMLLAVTAVLVAVGVYVIGKVRAGLRESEPDASQWLTGFRELHDRGELDDEEYRTIKSVLSEQLQHEIDDTDKPR
ncbi:MAG: SHOCT domain-containing protein [Planctomycetota bacterium]|nr:MAG: SHOCT domain-containing protein [Planctomycetota bacterium]